MPRAEGNNAGPGSPAVLSYLTWRISINISERIQGGRLSRFDYRLVTQSWNKTAFISLEHRNLAGRSVAKRSNVVQDKMIWLNLQNGYPIALANPSDKNRETSADDFRINNSIFWNVRENPAEIDSAAYETDGKLYSGHVPANKNVTLTANGFAV